MLYFVSGLDAGSEEGFRFDPHQRVHLSYMDKDDEVSDFTACMNILNSVTSGITLESCQGYEGNRYVLRLVQPATLLQSFMCSVIDPIS